MKIIIFSGTTEGRQLSGMLAACGISHSVCVATKYGYDLMPDDPYVTVRVGRMDHEGMISYLNGESFGNDDTVVDATHPYASQVHANIKKAVSDIGCRLIRVSARSKDGEYDVRSYRNMEEFAAYADDTGGNILLTTGSNTLGVYSRTVSQETLARTYVRVLPLTESLEICASSGIESAHVIAMQGPFSYDMNAAVMKQYEIKHILTKDSGAAGGYDEKVKAAQDLGVICHVLARPDSDAAISVEEAFEELTGKRYYKPKRIFLVGTGMGDLKSITVEARDIIRSADAVFAAPRLLSKVTNERKYEMYLAEDIISVLSENEDIKNAVILYSGDALFYSGAKDAYSKLCVWDKDAIIRIIPGISSVSYLASRLGKSYDDAGIVSIHGRNTPEDIKRLTGTITQTPKTFVLMSDDADVRTLADCLKLNGTDARISIGRNLSYEDEDILTVSVCEACTYEGKGLITALIENLGYMK